MRRETSILTALVGALSLHALGLAASAGIVLSDSMAAAPLDMTVTTLPNGEILIDPSITVNAVSSGTASTDATKKHASEYDGPTQFTANYTIVLKPDKTVDSDKSTVTFTTNSYTFNGEKQDSNFTTLPITITGVTLLNNDPTKIVSFTFSSKNWYPSDADGADSIVGNGNGLSGSINLVTGASTYTASYVGKNSKATYTYTITSVPEPASWIMMLTGIPGIVVIAYRRRAPAERSGPARVSGGPRCGP